jgi:uncharacterized protein
MKWSALNADSPLRHWNSHNVNPFGQFVLCLLRGYKWIVSPIFPPACRYVPTCSEYAMEAVERYGAVRGGLMATWRVLRCHPFVKGGYDPVVNDSPAAGANRAS